MSDTTAPPAPTAAAPEPPAEAPLAPPEPMPTPAVDQVDDVEPRTRRRRGGVPIEPLVIGAGNGTAMAATAAYQAAGPAGLAAAAGTAVALAAGGILQRRRTVRARTTTGAGRLRGGTGGAGRGRTRGGAGTATPRRGGQALGGAGRRGGILGAGAGSRGGAGRSHRGAPGGNRAAGLNTPRLRPGAALGKHRRPRNQDGGGNAPRKRIPRNRLGMLRPAATAARAGMAGAGRALRGTGRGIAHAGRWAAAPARALWRRTATARRAAARHARRIAGAAWDGALAGLAGFASALWQRSVRAGLGTLRAIWRRRRQRRAARRTAAGPAMTGPAAASAPPPVATFVRRPALAGGSPSTLGGHMSGGHHFLAGAMELERVATTYEPDGMMQVGRDFAALPEALEHIANAFKISTARADAEQPLDPRIIEIMQQLYLLQMKSAELARELPGAFRKLHDVDIERLQNPRKGRHAEAQWDVRANADTSL